MKNRLTDNAKKYLQTIADLSGAKSYREWLTGKIRDDADSRRQSAATAGATPAGYGKQGENLRAAGLAEDGYAAYLESERRNALAKSEKAIEQERTDGVKKLADGYADYLQKVRDERGNELISGAETMLSLPADRNQTAEQYAGLIAKNGEQKRALLEEFRSSVRLSPAVSTLNTLTKQLLNEGFEYQGAYRYCIAIGLSASDADRVATYCGEVAGQKAEYIEKLRQEFLKVERK